MIFSPLFLFFFYFKDLQTIVFNIFAEGQNEELVKIEMNEWINNVNNDINIITKLFVRLPDFQIVLLRTVAFNGEMTVRVLKGVSIEFRQISKVIIDITLPVFLLL